MLPNKEQNNSKQQIPQGVFYILRASFKKVCFYSQYGEIESKSN